MRKCRPTKWLPWAFIGAGLPLLAAGVISTNYMKSDVVDRAKAALAGSDVTKWADIKMDGRVATVTGTTTNEAAIAEVVKTVAGTYGVRQVVSQASYAPLTLLAPTVESLKADAPVTEIVGTWPEGAAKALTVTAAGTAYVLGTNPELTSTAGNWKLQLASPLPQGTYEVTASASVDSDGATATSATEAPAQIVVNAAQAAPAVETDVSPPEMPKLAAIAAGSSWPYAITGTFPEADTKKLTATVDGRTYTMGSGAALTSDGKGTFTFAPARKFAPGSYDIDFNVYDAAGNVTNMKAPAAIVVAEPAPTAPPPDTTAPAAPSVVAVAADVVESRSVSGTFDASDTAKFAANFQGREYVLGRGSALVAGESAGTFSFTPNTARLAPGKYDVDFAAYDAAGNASTIAAPQSIIIPEPPKVMEPAPVAAAEPPSAPPLAEPTVAKQLDLTGAPILTGTWPEGDGATLSVGLAGKTYDLATSANLRSDGAGKWRLFPSAALKDGIYDVVVTATRGEQTARDATVAEVEVDATLPATPTAVAYASNVAPTALTGTYDAKHAKSVKVSLPELNISAELGAAGSALTADGAGNWTLALAQPIAPGTYNVTVTTTDEHGRMSEDASAGEVVVSAANQPAPKVDRPYDCEAVMSRISTVFPMRFIYDKIDFDERFGLSVSQYAALLKDSRCATLKVELGGHTDNRGSDAYNEGLAERRAAKVRDMIVEAGIDTSRLTVASYGESQPADTSETEAGWAKNRRVDVKIMK